MHRAADSDSKRGPWHSGSTAAGCCRATRCASGCRADRDGIVGPCSHCRIRPGGAPSTCNASPTGNRAEEQLGSEHDPVLVGSLPFLMSKRRSRGRTARSRDSARCCPVRACRRAPVRHARRRWRFQRPSPPPAAAARRACPATRSTVRGTSRRCGRGGGPRPVPHPCRRP